MRMCFTNAVSAGGVIGAMVWSSVSSTAGAPDPTCRLAGRE